MKRFAIAVLASMALAAAHVAPAAMIVGSQLNGNLLTDFSGPGSLEVDLAFFNDGPVVLTVQPDATTLAFNDLVSFLVTGGAHGLLLTLGGGATWGLVGSIQPITAPSFSVLSSSTNVSILFNPREFIEVDLGNVGFGGTNWQINTSQVAGNFTLGLQVIPEPATVLLLGSALLGVYGFRKRAG
jgi:hypothetical protein